MMIRGIRWRIVLTYLVLIVLALSIFGVYMMQFIEKLYMDNLDEHVQEETALVAQWIAPHLDFTQPGQRTEVTEMLRKTSGVVGGRLTLIDAKGNVLIDTMQDDETKRNQLSHPEVAQAEHGSVGMEVRNASYSSYNVLHLAVPVFVDGQQRAVIRTAVPLQGAHDTLQGLWGSIGISLLIVAVVAALFGLRFAHSIAAPIEAITRTTRQIADGAFHERIHQRGRDELGVMSDAINAMASRMDEQLEDVTQQKGKLEGIITNLVSGVMVIDRSGRITLVNRAAEMMIGIHADVLVNKWHWEAGHNFGLSTLIDEAILMGAEQKKEVILHKPVERDVEAYVTPIRTTSGAIAGAVVLIHDVSEWRRLERMRSEFVANVSHELRTPITAVKGFSETLLDGAMNDPTLTKQFLQIIYDESERLRHLVNDLLELSKIESGHTVFHLKPTSLDQLVSRTVARYSHEAESNGLILRKELPEEQVTVNADEDRITQVLINLVGNAIHYTSAGGEVTVAVKALGDEAVIEVSDTGIGIPAEDLPRVFERFYRVDKARARRSGGTGLGLAIVKHIVEVHGGRVEVKSKVGQGSTFRVSLPKEPPQLTATS